MKADTQVWRACRLLLQSVLMSAQVGAVAVHVFRGGLLSQLLRVFVSSTMRDLANERLAVVDQLRQFNLEAVNAEGLLPTGGTSWDVLEREIRTSDIFVLILGEHYGWVPTSGPRANGVHSVTELEYRLARDCGLLILPFVKRLSYDSDRSSTDARNRDEFRKQVADWADGRFRGEFDLASDLAPQVAKAVIGVLTESFVSKRSLRRPLAAAPVLGPSSSTLMLPEELVTAVNDRSAILFAGAGMSMQAGLPSAAAFTEALYERISVVDPEYVRPTQGSIFNVVASDLVDLLGDGALNEAVQDLLAVESAAVPGPAQELAVEHFDLILTTNYDNLLETADHSSRLKVVEREIGDHSISGPAIVKLHGSFDDPSWLVLTEKDLLRLPKRRRRLLNTVRSEMQKRPVVVVGSSLRDPSVVELFNAAGPTVSGWVVNPVMGEVERQRFKRWNLEPVTAFADRFFASLSAALPSARLD